MAQVPNPNDYPSGRDNVYHKDPGEVKVTEKSLRQKFWDVFQLTDISEIKEYIIGDLIIPGFKRGARGVLDIILDGEVRPSGKSSGGTRFINYNKPRSSYREEDNSRKDHRKGNRDFRMIEFTSKDSAEKVKNLVLDEFRKYKQVPIASFYEYVEKVTEKKITIYFTDFNYGWTDLTGLTVVGRPGHYTLDFPRAETLD